MSTQNAPEAPSAISTKPRHLVRAERTRRKRRLREFVRKLRRTRNSDQRVAQIKPRTPRARRRKRKTALAASAALVSFSTPAMSEAPQDKQAASVSISIPVEIRQDASKLRSSTALMEAIAEEEGVHLTAYRDPIGLPTVGVGHLIKSGDNIKLGQTISHEKAMELLEEDLKHAEQIVEDLVGDLPLYQHEFDALVDLVFNVGEGTVSEAKSPRLNAAIAAGDYDGIAAELAYENARGVSLKGLEYRSERRIAMFADGNYENPRPAFG